VTGILHQLWNQYPSSLKLGWQPFRSITGRNSFIDAVPGSWQPLARREFHRLARTPGVWALGLLVLGAGVLSLSPSTLVQDSLGSRVPLAGLQTPIGFLAGIGILFGTFRSVIRERNTGSIRFTAGTAVSRSNTLISIVLGRAAAFAIPIVFAVLCTCLAAVPRYGLVSPITLAGFLAVTLIFVGCMTGLGVAISTITRSQSVAGVVILVYTGMNIAWFQLSNALYSAVTGTSVSGFAPPDNPIFLFVRWVPASRLFTVVTNAILEVANAAAPAASVIQNLQPNVFSNIVIPRLAYGVDVPVWYLHPAVSLVELLLWFVVPFGVALVLYQYRSVD
jgi:ABC-2 type transport system permease protein